MAQYADCEATRYCILTAMWEIKQLERWKRFFDCSLNHLREKNTTSASRFEFFKKCCLDLGREEGHPEERSILMDAVWRDASALGAMQKGFKDTEEVAISLGVFSDAKESCGFYFGVADSSNAKESSQSSSSIPHLSKSVMSDPEAPSTSDLEVPYTSDSEIPFPMEDSSDIECCFAMRNNQGRKSMKKPLKGSGLNPCLQPDMSQLGIPSEFMHDPTQIPESAMSAFQEELDYYNFKARGLGGHLDSSETEPEDPKSLDGQGESWAPTTSAEKKEVEVWKAKMKAWRMGKAVIKQQIARTLPDSLFTQIKQPKMAHEIFRHLAKLFEQQSRVVAVEILRKMQNLHCREREDVHKHFDTL
ncbi:hypothetical protein F5141DRAFT_1221653 [Pisolithus sp. B1]|nr:hypothetical protein F5141DRAFT_1221653 [Pisolithus sp. B1]